MTTREWIKRDVSPTKGVGQHFLKETGVNLCRIGEMFGQIPTPAPFRRLPFTRTVPAALVLLLGISSIMFAQSEEETPIKVNTLLANIPVIVSDKQGRHVAGLKAEDFKVTSGGAENEIVYFSDAQMPLSVAIVLDETGSVSAVLGGIKKAAKQFIDQLGPEDQCMVVTFGEVVRIRQPFSSDKEKAKNSIGRIAGISGGIGLMNQAMLNVLLEQFAGVKGRKAIIILSDAGEIATHLNRPMLDELIEGDTVVYPIYYHTTTFGMKLKNPTLGDLIKQTPVGILDDMARFSGGRLLVANGDDFVPQFQAITDELKKMYVVGFYPQESEGKPKNIDLKLVRTDLVLRTKAAIRPKTQLKPGVPKGTR